MKANTKKMIVILGIVLGFTVVALNPIFAGRGWIPESLYEKFQFDCNEAGHAIVLELDRGTPNGIPSVDAVCVCEPGYVLDYNWDHCIPEE